MWLAAAPEHDHDTICTEQTAENAQALEALRTESEHLGLRLPEAFVKFMDAPWLHKRIRSNTLCFLDLGPAPIPSPKGEGYLIRFLADSQGCLFWYLYLTPDGSDHAVVSSVDFYGTEAEQWQDEKPDPYAIVFCAESFETFMCRFWLENEIWFAEYEKTPMSEVGLVYIEQYRRNQVQPPIEYGG